MIDTVTRCVFVVRRGGKIVTMCGKPRPGTEWIYITDPDVVEFLKTHPDPGFDDIVGRPLVPEEVPAGGFYVALIRMKWKAAVDAAIAQADEESQVLYAKATHFRRSDPRLLAIATAIGKTELELDDLFILADSV